MIYFDSCALLKFVKQEKESGALRSWRHGLPAGMELVTSQLSGLEISRTLLRAGVDHRGRKQSDPAFLFSRYNRCRPAQAGRRQ